MAEIVNLNLFGDCLVVGTAGFVVGVAFPLAFRLIGYVLDSARNVIEG